MDCDGTGGETYHAVAAPYRQLLVDAFPRHADKGGQFLLGQPHVDLDTVIDRLAETLRQPDQTARQSRSQIQK